MKGVNMKTIMRYGLFFCFVVTFSSCNKLLPIDYDKAGRDVMALMANDASLTVADFQKSLRDGFTPGVSSKDFFTMFKMDSSYRDFIQALSLDMVQAKMKELKIDINNLKRALEE
jgi:hypothetical protein